MAVPDLIQILDRDRSDPWTVTAVLSSAGGKELELLSHLVSSPKWNKDNAREALDVFKRLASLIAARGDEIGLASCLRLVAGALAVSGREALRQSLAHPGRNGRRTGALRQILE